MKWYFYVGIVLVVAVVGAAAIFVIKSKQKNSGESGAKHPSQTVGAKKLVFSHKLFDTDKVKNITPLGELNGGGDELQTLNSVMVQLDKSKMSGPIEVYAPTDMELISYAYTASPDAPNGDWNIEFKIDERYNMTIHHLNNASEIITSRVGNETTWQDSRSKDVKPTIKFSAGELIGTTAGTSLGFNWNIYLYDKQAKNKFINMARYENGGYLGERLLTSVCPFDYYEDQATKSSYYALLGVSKAGQTASCGSPSKDKAGTLSGLWHLKPTGVESGYDGEYSNPLSVYMRSDKNVIIYELNKKFATIPPEKKSYKNPEEVTTSHCYNLADDWGSNVKSGYAYFRLDSEAEMSLAYSATGFCPSEFPADIAKKYYR